MTGQGNLENRSSKAPERERLLVVDDDGVFRQLLRTVFESCGYEVRVAENGARGLAVMETWRPDLVLLDIRMPVLDGLKFLDILREERGDTTPVLVVTSLNDRSLAVNALVAGASEVLLKPVKLQSLRDKIDVALRGRKRKGGGEAP